MTVAMRSIVDTALGATASSSPARGCRTVLFPTDLLDLLIPHAQRRGCRVNELARRIVDTVVEEGLVDAVLDDGASP